MWLRGGVPIVAVAGVLGRPRQGCSRSIKVRFFLLCNREEHVRVGADYLAGEAAGEREASDGVMTLTRTPSRFASAPVFARPS